jgi:hypothetical protein
MGFLLDWIRYPFCLGIEIATFLENSQPMLSTLWENLVVHIFWSEIRPSQFRICAYYIIYNSIKASLTNYYIYLYFPFDSCKYSAKSPAPPPPFFFFFLFPCCFFFVPFFVSCVTVSHCLLSSICICPGKKIKKVSVKYFHGAKAFTLVIMESSI